MRELMRIAEKLESMRDVQRERASDVTKKHFDRRCVRRQLEPG